MRRSELMKITVIQGHPDASGRHYLHALAEAYVEGARSAHEIRRIEVAALDFPLLHSKKEWSGPVPPSLETAHDAILWADHLVILFPLWLGDMPALLKGFLEQAIRIDIDAAAASKAKSDWRVLKGKSARIIVTMGMPALIYRWYFFAHGVTNLRRGILGFVGARPVRETLIGSVEAMSDTARRRWLETMPQLGGGGGGSGGHSLLTITTLPAAPPYPDPRHQPR
eukprot:gene26068-28460_t